MQLLTGLPWQSPAAKRIQDDERHLSPIGGRTTKARNQAFFSPEAIEERMRLKSALGTKSKLAVQEEADRGAMSRTEATQTGALGRAQLAQAGETSRTKARIKGQEKIAASRIAAATETSKKNRESRESIAGKNRKSREGIASQARESAESIAKGRMAGKKVITYPVYDNEGTRIGSNFAVVDVETGEIVKPGANAGKGDGTYNPMGTTPPSGLMPPIGTVGPTISASSGENANPYNFNNTSGVEAFNQLTPPVIGEKTAPVSNIPAVGSQVRHPGGSPLGQGNTFPRTGGALSGAIQNEFKRLRTTNPEMSLEQIQSLMQQKFPDLFGR